ncbi:MAG: hypothetical protein HY833_00655 [Candidatus Aenigmarchaeota archaeon]|nr:hypothetical protein [Candidatus Aenigmarchaeota archaeon]
MRDIKKKNSRRAKPAAKSAKVSNKQNMYIIAGILAVVVVSGIMLSQTSFLTPPNGQAPAEQVGQEQAEAVAEEQETLAYISLVNSPSSAYTNTPVSFIWKVDSGDEVPISHTAIHYDTRSVPSPAAYTDYRKAGRFFDGEVPGSFSDSMTILEAGTYYYRAHAVVGGKEIWSDEKTLVVSKRFG